MANYAWAGDVESFVATSDEELLDSLTAFTRETGGSQLLAWHRSIGVLREQLRDCTPQAEGMGVVLEYELPRTGGRRPDLILLENGTVILVEFKNRVEAESSDFDQVRRYVLDLQDYHAGCRERTLVPVLIPLGMKDAPFERGGIRVLPPSQLGALVRSLSPARRPRRSDVAAWTSAPYEPLPGLVEAARLLFERQPLPRVRRAESARVPEVLALLEGLVKDTVEKRGRALALVSGVPGSGKTLVGLQLAHSRKLPVPSLFLSGNGPLVQVLQYALGGGSARREFIQSLRVFLKESVGITRRKGVERVIIFDEAQRAWDRERVLQKHQGHLVGSEPELLVRVADQVADQPFVLVALMGEGQEIHAGEEAGIGQWVEALVQSSGWEVLGPEHLVAPFREAGIPAHSDELLNLTTSLRSHRGSRVAEWVHGLLAGELVKAHSIAEELRGSGFDLYLSRELEPLKRYVRERYSSDPGSRYGVLASSKFRKLESHGVRPVQANFWYYGQWYEEGPKDPRSCCQLDTAVSEFGCQGLELDMPIVCWGPDLFWTGGGWEIRTGKSRLIHDPVRIRHNAYRVLLTRGRDGVCIFVPHSSDGTMDATSNALVEAGVALLP